MPGAGRPARLAAGALAAVLLCALAAAPEGAAQSASLGASFVPYRLGARTTIALDLHIQGAAGQLPPALTAVEVRYPEDLGFALSGLGLEVCSPAILEASGTGGCPANSIMGRGSALAELRFGEQQVSEATSITIARAPDQEGHIAVLLYAVGPSPVNTQILSPALLLAAAAPFGGRLDIALPVIPSVPEGPDVAIVAMSLTLGPLGLTYYEQSGDATLAYTPRGILLPTMCPRGGFPFAATFSFVDGTRTDAHTTVPCADPRRRGGRRS